MHHHGVEPGVEAAQRLLQRVGLVEEQGDRHARPPGDLAAEGAEQLDPAAVEPGLMPEQAAGADDHRRPLGLRGLDDGLERVAVPGLEVPERVPARAGVREQGRQRDERHGVQVSRKASASARVKSPAVQPSFVHAEAPITLRELEAAAEVPVLEQPVDEPGGEGVTGAGRLDEVDARGGQLDRLVAARGDEPALAQRHDHGPGAELEQALGLPARVALSRQRGRLVVVRHEVVDLGQDARDVVERQCSARPERRRRTRRACPARRACRSCSASSSCRSAGSTRKPPT